MSSVVVFGDEIANVLVHVDRLAGVLAGAGKY